MTTDPVTLLRQAADRLTYTSAQADQDQWWDAANALACIEGSWRGDRYVLADVPAPVPGRGQATARKAHRPMTTEGPPTDDDRWPQEVQVRARHAGGAGASATCRRCRCERGYVGVITS